MKLKGIFAAAGAAMMMTAASAIAQQAADVPVFEFNVERVALQDDTNTHAIYERLVTEAGAYCNTVVPVASVEFPVCIETMVTHVVGELEHAPLTRLHEARLQARQQPQQAVAFNAG